MKRPRAFILSLWVAIGVALLSALAPLGPPASRLTGSAFNPATTSVAIKARRPDSPLVAQTAKPDGRDKVRPTLAILWLMPLLLLAAERAWLALRSPVPVCSFARRRPARHSRPPARAPPALS